MPDRRIVCITHGRPTAHRHITSVGIEIEPDRCVEWPVTDVVETIGASNRFYIYRSGAATLIEAFTCDCGFESIRTVAGAALAQSLE